MSTPTRPAGPAPLGPAAVADILDTLAAADRQVAAELDRIATFRSPVSHTMVAALERLLATLRPAADLRAELVGVDHRVLAAAIGLRSTRRGRRAVPGGAQ